MKVSETVFGPGSSGSRGSVVFCTSALVSFYNIGGFRLAATADYFIINSSLCGIIMINTCNLNSKKLYKMG